MEDKQLIPPKEEDYFDKYTLIGFGFFLLIMLFAINISNKDLTKSLNEKKIYSNATIFDIYRSKSGTHSRYYYSYKGKTLYGETVARNSYYRGANYFVIFNPNYPNKQVFIPIKIPDSLYSPQNGWTSPPITIKEEQLKKYINFN